jgi:acyl-coenzyme A thioesterase PaaI-like protein
MSSARSLQGSVAGLPVQGGCGSAAKELGASVHDGAAVDCAPQLVAVMNPRCMVCGQQNPHGLQLAFFAEDGGVDAEWDPEKDWESFPGVIHGGVISTVLDEAMSKAIIAHGLEAFTVELRVRFKEKLRPGETVRVQGWVVEKRKRRIAAEAKLYSGSGREYAHAWGVFLIPQRTASPVA